MIECNEWRAEKWHECANMGKVKRLELWWQLYRTSLPVWDLENFRPMDFCWHECTCVYFIGCDYPTMSWNLTFYAIHVASVCLSVCLSFRRNKTPPQCETQTKHCSNPSRCAHWNGKVHPSGTFQLLSMMYLNYHSIYYYLILFVPCLMTVGIYTYHHM